MSFRLIGTTTVGAAIAVGMGMDTAIDKQHIKNALSPQEQAAEAG